MTDFNSQTILDSMLADVEQCYDIDCLRMATVEEYVKDAVSQLYQKGYCKQQYWMRLAMNLQDKLDKLGDDYKIIEGQMK